MLLCFPFVNFLFLIGIFLLFPTVEASSCRQGIFLPAGGLISSVNVTKTLKAKSLMDCTQHCFKESCDSVKYRNRHDKVNCQLLAQTDNRGVIADTDLSSEEWSTYTLQSVKSSSCVEGKFCQNDGKCVANMCEPEGYSCTCPKIFCGKHCEKSCYDFDIIFPNGSNNYARMHVPKKVLTQFTFTLWFKSQIGFLEYPLLRYKKDDEINTAIDIYFTSPDVTSPVFQLNVFILGTNASSWTIPVINDGYWHHIGFIWDSVSGDTQFLIDGVLWAVMEDILKGQSVGTGSSLIIGQRNSSNLVGSLSLLNLWSKALNGREIEAMSKRPGNEYGDLIDWFNVKDNLVGNTEVIAPSGVSIADITGMDDEITLGTNVAIFGGLTKDVDQISTCTWFKRNSVNPMFFAHTTAEVRENFAFGYGSQVLTANINNVFFESDTIISSKFMNHWHIVCMTWDGKEGIAVFYIDGQILSIKNNTELKTIVPAGGTFTIGLEYLDGDFASYLVLSGKMTQLNIWGSILHPNNIMVMSAGCGNIRGDILSWGDLAHVINGSVGTTVNYIPGYDVLDRRTKYCNDKFIVNTAYCSLSRRIFARLGGSTNKREIVWRCYCSDVLLPGKYTFDYLKNTGGYFSKSGDILKIN